MPLTTTQYRPTEIRFFGSDEGMGPQESVMLAAAAGALAKGTVLGKITSSGLFKAYSKSNSDGSEVPVAILAADAADDGSNDVPARVHMGGYFLESALTGLDSAAKILLGGKSHWNGAFSFGLQDGRVRRAGTTLTDAAYTQVLGDQVLEVPTLTAARTITLLPVATLGANFELIVNAGPSAATYNVTIDANASETIDGATTKVLSAAYGVARLKVNAAGTAWISI